MAGRKGQPKPRINWEKARIDYVERRATGEALQFKRYAKELGVTERSVRNHAKAECWEDLVQHRTTQLVARAWDEVEIDQVAIRKALLAPGLVYARAQFDLAMAFQQYIQSLLAPDPDTGLLDPEALLRLAELPMKELRLLQQITKELAETGGGLPKFHQVTVDDHHHDVVANRQQLRCLEEKARELREYARVRRLGPYRDGEPEDAELVDVPPAMRRRARQ